jgi:ATP-dependent DNA helicase PIF1
MLDKELFDKISAYLSFMRRNDFPFGGLQVILTGDFCQLEPVSGDYCFTSDEWERLEMETIYLKKMIRQDSDIYFQKMLSKLRYGECSEKIFNKLESLKTTEFGDIKPTVLYPRTYDVDLINNKEYEKLIKLGSKKMKYEIILPTNKQYREKTENWFKTLDIPDSVEICIGAQVIVTTNVNQEEGIVNGTRGVVVDVKSDQVIIKRINNKLYPIKFYKTVSIEDKNIKVEFMPLKLAYALTIHKSQGMTIDAVEIDIGPKIFASGQAYTAISRAQNLQSIRIKSVHKESFKIKNSVLEFYKKIEEEINKKNNNYVLSIIDILIFNVVNHKNLENSFDFIWQFTNDDDEVQKFIEDYNFKPMELEYCKYEVPNEPKEIITDDDKIDKVIIMINKIKDNMLLDLDRVIKNIKKYKIKLLTNI